MSRTLLDHRRLAEGRTLKALLAVHFAILVALGTAIWFEAPREVASAFRTAAWIAAALAAISTGLTVARSQRGIHPRDRPSISGRGAGVLAFVALASLTMACAKLIYPRSWPTSVEDALALLDEQVGAAGRQELAYMGYDDLADLNEQWSASIPQRFGLLDGNARLLKDCDPEYIHAATCASVIISRFWKKVRAELPAPEREALEALEAKMERVRFKSQRFDHTPLKEVVAFFSESVRAQLPEDARFEIRYDPKYADDPVSAAWRVMDSISLREALGNLAAATHWRVRKAPPDLVLEEADSG